MKTNNMMQVRIGDHVQEIEHLTEIGNLNTLWAYGNGLRVKKGLNTLNLDDYLRKPETVEFMVVLHKKLKYGESPYYEGNDLTIEYDVHGRTKVTSGQLACLRTKRGKGGGTWAHLYILLDAAATLDPEFKLEVYDTFVKNKILQWRDDSGEEFKTLNIAIDAYLPDRVGKDNHWIYVNSAKMLKAKIKPNGDSWNTASHDQLEKRTKYETKLIDFLKMGLVKDWEHLKEIIAKI